MALYSVGIVKNQKNMFRVPQNIIFQPTCKNPMLNSDVQASLGFHSPCPSQAIKL